MLSEINKKKLQKTRKHVETKHYATKQPMDHLRNLGWNLKIPSIKWQQRQNNQNLWGAANAGLRGRSIAIQAYLRSQKKFQVNNLNFYLKQLEKNKKKVIRRKEIIKIIEEINEIETKKKV